MVESAGLVVPNRASELDEEPPEVPAESAGAPGMSRKANSMQSTIRFSVRNAHGFNVQHAKYKVNEETRVRGKRRSGPNNLVGVNYIRFSQVRP